MHSLAPRVSTCPTSGGRSPGLQNPLVPAYCSAATSMRTTRSRARARASEGCRCSDARLASRLAVRSALRRCVRVLRHAAATAADDLRELLGEQVVFCVCAPQRRHPRRTMVGAHLLLPFIICGLLLLSVTQPGQDIFFLFLRPPPSLLLPPRRATAGAAARGGPSFASSQPLLTASPSSCYLAAILLPFCIASCHRRSIPSRCASPTTPTTVPSHPSKLLHSTSSLSSSITRTAPGWSFLI